MGLSTVSIALGHSGWAEYSLRLNAAAWKAWDAACITAGKWLHTLASYLVLQSGSSVLNRVYKKGQMKRYWDLQFDNLMIWRQQFSTHNKMRKRVTIWGVTREWKCNCSSFLQIVSVLFLSFKKEFFMTYSFVSHPSFLKKTTMIKRLHDFLSHRMTNQLELLLVWLLDVTVLYKFCLGVVIVVQWNCLYTFLPEQRKLRYFAIAQVNFSLLTCLGFVR